MYALALTKVRGKENVEVFPHISLNNLGIGSEGMMPPFSRMEVFRVRLGAWEDEIDQI